MANYCSNRIVFAGSKAAIQKIQVLFDTLRQQEDQTGKGQLPDFVSREEGYFLDLYWDGGDVGTFQYETRWAPNTEVVKEIADHYKVGFTLDYEELGNLVYGKVTYSRGQLLDVYLEPEDFDRYELDFETGIYHFEGQPYEYDCEILEMLLERKIQKNTVSSNPQH